LPPKKYCGLQKNSEEKIFRVITIQCQQYIKTYCKNKHFSHPDFTVGTGITPVQPITARGLYHRSGISPCPEDSINLSLKYHILLKLSILFT
jgi:hypothetical protein